MSKVAVIGGGPAGMMAAIAAAGQGHEVSLWEKNEKTGKKLYITGKGRCNVTNNCTTEEFLQAVCVNRRFLYSAGYGFDSQSVMDFFEAQGLSLKTERGGRVFPSSDHSSDVIAALVRAMKARGVQIHLNQEVKEVLTSDGCAAGIRLASGRQIDADAVIVATGGISYRTTGSTGDGYRFAREAGHQVTELSPSLVPLETAEDDPKKLQGLSLRNVEVTIRDGKKELYRGFGEMMFTHFGVTGPLILTASTVIQKQIASHPLQMLIDLKPALDMQQLDARILREFEAAKNKQLKNILGALYPAKLVPVMMEKSQIPPEKAVRDITKEERRRLAELTKSFPLTITSLRDYNEAIITRGGVSVKEIQPATMESRLVSGLYFAGEVLDLDAVTGGYNLQIAWCTGYAAGMGVR
jgi:hypothetical protein